MNYKKADGTNKTRKEIKQQKRMEAEERFTNTKKENRKIYRQSAEWRAERAAHNGN